MRPAVAALLVGAGGFLGANARYWSSVLAIRYCGEAWPWGTLSINVLGSFLLGVLVTGGAEEWLLDPRLRLSLAVGFLGAFTTFSTFELETMGLLADRAWLPAAAYVGCSVLVGLVAVWAGAAIGRTIG